MGKLVLCQLASGVKFFVTLITTLLFRLIVGRSLVLGRLRSRTKCLGTEGTRMWPLVQVLHNVGLEVSGGCGPVVTLIALQAVFRP